LLWLVFPFFICFSAVVKEFFLSFTHTQKKKKLN
jgi:hypothetical protein